jgi:hypothetical protein
MKNLFNVSSFLLIACLAFANASQQGIKSITISGTVVDDPWPAKRMPFPIQGARVFLSILSPVITASPQPLYYDSTITDQTGAFALKSVLAGSHRITFTHKDFNGRQINLSGVNDTSLQISLVSKSAYASFTGSVWVPCPDDMDCARRPAVGCNVFVYKGNTIFPYTFQSELISPEITAPVFSTITNASGQYSIDSVPITINGEPVTVSAAISGYETKNIDTTIRNMQATQLDFSLKSLTTPKDSLRVLPQKPTTRDSITFQLFKASFNCFTSYINNIVQVNDSSIYLSYTYSNTPCDVCACAATGTWTSFKTGPIAAGTYAVYAIGLPYCSTQPCMCVKTAPTRMGTLTVVKALTIALRNGNTPEIKTSPRLMITGSQLIVELQQSGAVTIRAFSLSGKLLAKPIESFLSAGPHRITLSSLYSEIRTNKPIVLTMQINGVMTSHVTIMNIKGK